MRAALLLLYRIGSRQQSPSRSVSEDSSKASGSYDIIIFRTYLDEFGLKSFRGNMGRSELCFMVFLEVFDIPIYFF